MTAEAGYRNDYGFSALPGGAGFLDGSFHNVGYLGYWWSAREHISESKFAYHWGMGYSYETVNVSDCDKPYLYSVRCVQD